MCQVSSGLFRLQQVFRFVRAAVGGVTHVRARVQPVVRADGYRHETEGSERAQSREKSLNAAVTASHGGGLMLIRHALASAFARFLPQTHSGRTC